MKMIKKGIFAVALLAMLAVTVNAGDLAKNPLKVDSTSGTKDPNNIQYMPGGWGGEFKQTFWWPYTINICYKPLEICQIPVYMEIGMYAEMLNCSTTKIVLKQVACTSLDATAQAKFGLAGAAGSFPCYTGCTDIQLRGNFNMQLGTVLYKTSVVGKPGVYVIDDGKWQARYTTKYQTPGDVITGDGAYHKTEICVDAWSADIFYQTVGTQVQVGEVAVTVMPTGGNCCPTVQ
jgi:hypothetical protein